MLHQIKASDGSLRYLSRLHTSRQSCTNGNEKLDARNRLRTGLEKTSFSRTPINQHVKFQGFRLSFRDLRSTGVEAAVCTVMTADCSLVWVVVLSLNITGLFWNQTFSSELWQSAFIVLFKQVRGHRWSLFKKVEVSGFMCRSQYVVFKSLHGESRESVQEMKLFSFREIKYFFL